MLALYALFLLSYTIIITSARNQNLTTCKDSSITWWNNDHGDSPCLVFQNLLGLCQPGFQMWNTTAPPNVDDCIDSGCCCNSVAYSLYVACYACQWGATDIPADMETYGNFLGVGSVEVQATGLCPGDGGINIGTFQPEYATQLESSPPPAWSFIPVGLNDVWNYQVALKNVSMEASISSMSIASTSSVARTATFLPPASGTGSTPSATGPTNTSTPPASAPNNFSPGAIAGLSIGVVVALFMLCAVIFLSRRRTMYLNKQCMDSEPESFACGGESSSEDLNANHGHTAHNVPPALQQWNRNNENHRITPFFLPPLYPVPLLRPPEKLQPTTRNPSSDQSTSGSSPTPAILIIPQPRAQAGIAPEVGRTDSLPPPRYTSPSLSTSRLHAAVPLHTLPNT